MAYSSLLPHHPALAFFTYPSPILLPFSAPSPVLAPPPPHTGPILLQHILTLAVPLSHMPSPSQLTPFSTLPSIPRTLLPFATTLSTCFNMENFASVCENRILTQRMGLRSSGDQEKRVRCHCAALQHYLPPKSEPRRQQSSSVETTREHKTVPKYIEEHLIVDIQYLEVIHSCIRSIILETSETQVNVPIPGDIKSVRNVSKHFATQQLWKATTDQAAEMSRRHPFDTQGRTPSKSETTRPGSNHCTYRKKSKLGRKKRIKTGNDGVKGTEILDLSRLAATSCLVAPNNGQRRPESVLLNDMHTIREGNILSI
ncbi:hypothetical protein PR048_026743 [Dryococelus australis]|uniref:Uncharacterized protein n=1 Tax=Dryococelus australis TaxID=614101 RepID=A0ABQ9GM74_9NEOP|nr:hypothetical protein PR048_026743 [Dryococelus australis]